MRQFDSACAFQTRRIVDLAEDHLAGCGLEDRGDRNFNRPADHAAGVVDDDHGAVVQIADALVVLLAFLKDKDLHLLAGKDDWLE